MKPQRTGERAVRTMALAAMGAMLSLILGAMAVLADRMAMLAAKWWYTYWLKGIGDILLVIGLGIGCLAHILWFFLRFGIPPGPENH